MPVLDRDHEDDKDAVIDSEDCAVSPDPVRGEWDVLVTVELLYGQIRLLFCGKIVEGGADAPGFFDRQAKEIKIKVILYNLSRLMNSFSVLIVIEEFYKAVFLDINMR
jgi:hypothetical protein